MIPLSRKMYADISRVAVPTLIGFGCFLMSAAPAASQKPKAPFEIILSAESQTVKAGSDVFLVVTMKNISNRDVNCTRFPENGLDQAYGYEVVRKDDQSKSVAMKPKDMPNMGSITPCIIKPGESAKSFGSDLSRYYDLSRPGVYEIEVSRLALGKPVTGYYVKSNRILVTVVP